MYIKITRAFAILSDEDTKAEYDHLLQHGTSGIRDLKTSSSLPFFGSQD